MNETVDAAGSGLVFQDSYGLDGGFASLTSSEQAALETDVQQAESDLASEFTNSVTLSIDVEAVDVPPANGTGFIASNAASDYRAVTLSSYFGALEGVAASAYQSSAVADIENLTDLGGSNTVLLPEGYASMLGLSDAGEPVTDPSVQFTRGGAIYSLSSSVDDTLFINLAVVQTALEDQPANSPNNSVVGVIEHELTEEGMGRISSLLTQSVSGGIGAVWEPADFFRVNSAGQSDLTPNNGTAVFFSPEPGLTGPESSLQFNNNTSGGDLADWISNQTSDPNYTDPFGAGGFSGSVGTQTSALSPTDIDLMNVLGWTIASGGGSSTNVAPVASAAAGPPDANILWRNSNGDVEFWNSNGAGGFAGEDLGVVDLSWQIEGTGDFNGVGEDGILWRNSGGDVELWNANGAGGFTGEDLGDVASSWQIEGTGDFNGSGRDGIVWRNSNGDVDLWNANGSGGFTGEDLGVVGGGWQIAGTGDFTGTGEDSILWRNSGGDTELWNPNGSGGFTGEDLGVVPTSWQIEGTGDFNGSGRDGIVWRNSNGDVDLWNANASGAFTGENLGVVASSWQIFKQG
jgi:hypothetical protein